MNYASLKGRSVIVTGGNRGLGRAMALGLLSAGARVAIVCTRPGSTINDMVEQARRVAPDSTVKCAFGDLERPEDCERIVGEISAAFGRVDVLINNAALRMSGAGARFWETRPEDWLRTSHVNCDSVYLMSRAVAPEMVRCGFGKIINISTNGRTMARENFSPYGPSKAFVEACTRAWARELKGTGVTMNVLLPGGNIDTSSDLTGAPPSERGHRASIMVDPVLWLAADESNAHTGERFIATQWNEELDMQSRVMAAREDGADAPSIM